MIKINGVRYTVKLRKLLEEGYAAANGGEAYSSGVRPLEESKDNTFFIEGTEVLVSYAYHLLEYLPQNPVRRKH